MKTISTGTIHANTDCQTHQKRYYSEQTTDHVTYVSEMYYLATIFCICLSLIIPYLIPVACYCLYRAKKAEKLTKKKGGSNVQTK